MSPAPFRAPLLAQLLGSFMCFVFAVACRINGIIYNLFLPETQVLNRNRNWRWNWHWRWHLLRLFVFVLFKMSSLPAAEDAKDAAAQLQFQLQFHLPTALSLALIWP